MITLDCTHELVNPQRDIKGAFAQRKPKIKITRTAPLSLTFRIFMRESYCPFIFGKCVKQAVLPLYESYVFADIIEVQVFIKRLRRLASSFIGTSP